MFVRPIFAAIRKRDLCCRAAVTLVFYCVKTLSRIARGAAVPSGVSQIFPPHKKIHPPCKIYDCSGGLVLAPINAPHLFTMEVRNKNRTKAFEWYQFELPRVTSNPDFKVTV